MTGELKIRQYSENLHHFMNPIGGRIKMEQLKSDLACELVFSMSGSRMQTSRQKVTGF